jgi:hypothetical protein
MRNADENANVCAFFEIEDQTGVLDCFPRRFEEEPVLRIDVGRFPRRDSEKLRIKLIDLANESATLDDRSTGTSETASRPSTSSFQSESLALTPPGKRQPTPMMAMRSFSMVCALSRRRQLDRLHGLSCQRTDPREGRV